jgi:hypothetical protein
LNTSATNSLAKSRAFFAWRGRLCFGSIGFCLRPLRLARMIMKLFGGLNSTR